MQCYIVDAFSDRIFGGNPAAVCVLHDKWLPDSIMQNIAKEHNLSETAFCLCQDGAYLLRWFTPTHEVDLCGHATLASGFVVLNYIDSAQNQVAFKTQSGILYVRKQNHGDSKLYELDLPSYALSTLEPTSERCAQIEHNARACAARNVAWARLGLCGERRGRGAGVSPKLGRPAWHRRRALPHHRAWERRF